VQGRVVLLEERTKNLEEMVQQMLKANKELVAKVDAQANEIKFLKKNQKNIETNLLDHVDHTLRQHAEHDEDSHSHHSSQEDNDD